MHDLQFEFGKYTEVTDYLKENFPEKYKSYSRLFVCPDVRDAQFIRVMPGVNKDYQKEENSFLVEYEKIPNRYKGEEMTLPRLREIGSEDELECWDTFVFL
jgi:hypothetical protein